MSETQSAGSAVLQRQRSLSQSLFSSNSNTGTKETQGDQEPQTHLIYLNVCAFVH